jgi:hypothetical protein
VELSDDAGLLRMERVPEAPALRIVTNADADRFERVWLEAAVRASSRGPTT